MTETDIYFKDLRYWYDDMFQQVIPKGSLFIRAVDYFDDQEDYMFTEVTYEVP